MGKLQVIVAGSKGKLDEKWDSKIARKNNIRGRVMHINETGKKARGIVLFSDTKTWKFYTTEFSEYSSLAKPLSEENGFKIKNMGEVQTKTLDSVIEESSDGWNFLVVDIRGVGVNVLMGAAKSLDECIVGVEVVDFKDSSLYAGAKGIGRSKEYLESKGFKRIKSISSVDSNGKEVENLIFTKSGISEELAEAINIVNAK